MGEQPMLTAVDDCHFQEFPIYWIQFCSGVERTVWNTNLQQTAADKISARKKPQKCFTGGGNDNQVVNFAFCQILLTKFFIEIENEKDFLEDSLHWRNCVLKVDWKDPSSQFKKRKSRTLIKFQSCRTISFSIQLSKLEIKEKPLYKWKSDQKTFDGKNWIIFSERHDLPMG